MVPDSVSDSPDSMSRMSPTPPDPCRWTEGIPRYVLEILDLLKGDQGQKTASAEAETAELIMCEQHQKPCVMLKVQKLRDQLGTRITIT